MMNNHDLDILNPLMHEFCLLPSTNKQFAMEISWQKVDETGAAVEEEDITYGGTTLGCGGDTSGSELER